MRSGFALLDLGGGAPGPLPGMFVASTCFADLAHRPRELPAALGLNARTEVGSEEDVAGHDGHVVGRLGRSDPSHGDGAGVAAMRRLRMAAP